MVAVDASPDEVYNKRQRLWEELGSNDTNVAKEGAVTLGVSWINVDAGQSVGHLTPFMESNDLQIMSFITILHRIEECLGFTERCSKIRHQLVIVVVGKFYEFARSNLQGLQMQLNVFLLLITIFFSWHFLSHSNCVCSENPRFMGTLSG